MTRKHLGQSPGTGNRGDTACLESLLLESGLRPINAVAIASFDAYLKLILYWNQRTNLTAIRDGDGILRRHFLESIACAEALPQGILTLLDFGSGAGFPGIPISICRPEIAVTLAESQNKKATFLRQIVSALDLHATVFHGRAETLCREFDCVTLRAVDHMEKAVRQAALLVRSGGTLALMTTIAEFPGIADDLTQFTWQPPHLLPASNQRIIQLGTRRNEE